MALFIISHIRVQRQRRVAVTLYQRLSQLVAPASSLRRKEKQNVSRGTSGPYLKNVSRGTKRITSENVSRGTSGPYLKMFHVEHLKREVEQWKRLK